MSDPIHRRPLEGLRIVWAIAAKDIADAIRNRTTLSLIAGVALVMLMGRSLPVLLNLAPTPRLIVYDAGRSQLAEALRQSPRVRLSKAGSQQALEQMLLDVGGRVIGLALPAGLDDTLQAGGPLELDGYYAWADRSSVPGLKADAERLLGELAGRVVRIDIEGHVVYPRAGGPDGLTMTSLTLILVILMTGGFLVPCLMFEEKESRTMDALLVSPASVGQVVLGKALAGTTYCLTAGAVALACNWALVVHWELAALATVVGSLLAVAVGLLLGSLFENPQQMSLWGALPLLVLVLPTLLVNMKVALPPVVAALLPWIPTLPLNTLFRLSFCGAVPAGRLLVNLGVVLAWTVPVLAAVAWLVRRSDR